MVLQRQCLFGRFIYFPCILGVSRLLVRKVAKRYTSCHVFKIVGGVAVLVLEVIDDTT